VTVFTIKLFPWPRWEEYKRQSVNFREHEKINLCSKNQSTFSNGMFTSIRT